MTDQKPANEPGKWEIDWPATLKNNPKALQTVYYELVADHIKAERRIAALQAEVERLKGAVENLIAAGNEMAKWVGDSPYSDPNASQADFDSYDQCTNTWMEVRESARAATLTPTTNP